MNAFERMPTRRAALAAAAIFTMPLSSCSLSTRPDDTQGCDVCTTSAIVYGQVLDASGAPAPNLRIDVVVYKDSVIQSSSVWAGETNAVVRTDANGMYRDRPLSPLAPFRASVQVTVTTSPAGPAFTAFGARVDFRNDYPDTSRDSVRVDIRLPASTP